MNLSYAKLLITALCLLLHIGSVTAGMAPARLYYNDGSHDDVLAISYSAGTMTYKKSEKSLNLQRVQKPKLEAVYFYEPKAYKEAMGHYHSRNYAEAKEIFAKLETEYKTVDTLPDNYSTLSGFYKMECSRRMNDLEALSAELEKFHKKGLSRETHLQQLEVYSFWEAVRLGDWDRLDRLAVEWQPRSLAAGMRVQIEYCHARALDNLCQKDPSRKSQAINAYNRVLTADGTTSMELVLAAALGALNLYSNDDGVKLAMRVWGTDDENRRSAGYERLLEANTLVKFYKQSGFDDLQPLAKEHEKFLEFNPPKADGGGEPAAESAEEEQPAAEEADQEAPAE